MISSSATVSLSTPGSRRVEYKGKEYIRGSDEDSDDLQDLDVIIHQRRAIAPVEARPPPVKITKKENDTKKWQDSMSAIFKQMENDQAAATRIKEMDNQLREDGTLSYLSNGNGAQAVDDILADIYNKNDSNGEVDKAAKVKQAMARTEAMRYEPAFHFFEATIPPLISKYPKDCFPGDAWAKPLLDEAQCESAFRSGFVARIASLRPLPAELLQWILDQVCFEGREDLVSSYLNTLESSSKNFPNPLSKQVIRRLLNQLGARMAYIDSNTVVSEKQLVQNTTRPISPNLRWFLEMLSRLSPSMPPATISYAIQSLILLAMDHTVLHTPKISHLLSTTITSLITNLPKDDNEPYLAHVMSHTFSTLHDPVLRGHIIRHLPLHPPRAHLFRRRMALAFALNTIKHSLPPSSLINPALNAHVILALSCSYKVVPTPEYDYAALSSRIYTLDVAIDTGFHPHPAPADQQISHQLHITHRLNREHDANLDLLIAAVKEVFDSIIPLGAASLSRLEARGRAERLAQRLEQAVRIEPKGGKDWYEEDRKQEEKKKQFMEQFIAKSSEGPKVRFADELEQTVVGAVPSPGEEGDDEM